MTSPIWSSCTCPIYWHFLLILFLAEFRDYYGSASNWRGAANRTTHRVRSERCSGGPSTTYCRRSLWMWGDRVVRASLWRLIVQQKHQQQQQIGRGSTQRGQRIGQNVFSSWREVNSSNGLIKRAVQCKWRRTWIIRSVLPTEKRTVFEVEFVEFQ